jgi:hypothetical protein
MLTGSYTCATAFYAPTLDHESTPVRFSRLISVPPRHEFFSAP